MFTLPEINQATKTLASYILKTPLIRAYALEKAFNLEHRLFLKCEYLQVTGSFKARGAYLACLSSKGGIVTRSSGNFGIATAKTAREFSLPAHIVLSNSISSYKKNKISEYYPSLYFCSTRDEENKLVSLLSKKLSLTPLSPFDHDEVIKGQTTLGIETLQQLPTMKYFIGPIGGGGLMGGSSLAIKLMDKDINTIGVEPEKGNDYFLSRKTKKMVKLSGIQTICEGLKTPSVGKLTYPLLEKYVDDVFLVSDEDIIKTLKIFYEKMGLVLEPSGAISASIFLNTKRSFKGDVVCVLSGANIEQDQFLNLIG
jgi:threonine dehydratase